MKFVQTGLFLLLIALAGSLSGCRESSLELAVRYDTLGGLKAKAPVYFEGIEIGRVESVVSTEQGDYLVEITIEPEHKAKATNNSKFFILDDPGGSAGQALVVEQDPPGGTILKNGSIVQGEARRGMLDTLVTNLKKNAIAASGRLDQALQGLKESFAEGSRDLNERFEKALDDIDQYFKGSDGSPDSSVSGEELEKLQQALDDFIEEFRRSSEEMQARMRDSVVPHLRKELEDLRSRLKREGQTEDATRLEEQIERISDV